MAFRDYFNRAADTVLNITEPYRNLVANALHEITYDTILNPSLPLDKQPAIPLIDGDRMVSFDTILQTGYVDNNVYAANQTIDLDADDSFAKAWHDVRANVMEDLRQNSEMQNLMKLSSWTEADRANYERQLAETISKRVDEVPGLGEYRVAEFTKGTRSHNLNDLSEDIDNKTQRIEWDCEAMSVFEGTLAQSIENEMLADGEGLKAPHAYYYKTADANFSARQKIEAGQKDIEVGGHAYIVSSATGNIIESTNDPSVYPDSPYQEIEGDFTFADHVAGSPAVTKGGDLYASENFSQDIVNARAQAIASGNLEALNDLRSSENISHRDIAAAVQNPETLKPDYTPPPPEETSPSAFDRFVAGAKETAFAAGEAVQNTIDSIDRHIDDAVAAAQPHIDELVADARNVVSGFSEEEPVAVSAQEEQSDPGVSQETPVPVSVEEALPVNESINAPETEPGKTFPSPEEICPEKIPATVEQIESYIAESEVKTTESIQSYLKIGGLYGLEIDGIHGNGTEKGIENFIQSRGLDIDPGDKGAVLEALRNDPEIEKRMTDLVREGMSANRGLSSAVQTILENAGHDPQGIDGYIGPKTTAAYGSYRAEYFIDHTIPIQSIVAGAETIIPQKSYELGERSAISLYHRDLSDRVAEKGAFDFKNGSGTVLRSSGIEIGELTNGRFSSPLQEHMPPKIENPSVSAQRLSI